MSCQSCIATIEEKLNALQKVRKLAKEKANETKQIQLICQSEEGYYIATNGTHNVTEYITPN
jgi:copper chaperone CopZ